MCVCPVNSIPNKLLKLMIREKKVKLNLNKTLICLTIHFSVKILSTAKLLEKS